AVRLIHGKSPAGNIQLKLDVVGDALQIHLRDDGRGLALKKIRDKAVEKQLIGADAPLADEEIAQQIFRPGFSTADAVTEVSGRGVGMDAVQDFVRREQGRIEIRFTDNAVGADFRQFETIVYLPASLAEHVDGNLTLAPALARAEAGQPATAVTA
ncbi:MAG TPA: ATP-binding protein, partial [Rhodocyclaceae bacterium]